MPCRFCKWDECVFEDEEEDYGDCDSCPHYEEAPDPYLEFIKNEDAKVRFAEKCLI